jgi:hypothetical protein
MSLGPYRQLTAKWLDVLIYSLSLSEETSHLADAIGFAKDSGTLGTEVLFVDPATNNYRAVEVKVDEP